MPKFASTLGAEIPIKTLDTKPTVKASTNSFVSGTVQSEMALVPLGSLFPFLPQGYLGTHVETILAKTYKNYLRQSSL